MAKQWIEVATTDELPLGTMKRLAIEGKRYLLANANDRYYAVDELCSHEDVSLYLGCIQGENIKCSLHGSRFSLKTGEPLEDPATDSIGCYPVKLDGKRILIQVG
jgi:3-phenylpropionate/trans-cinnamate dioxygenase ferredoxin subunit